MEKPPRSEADIPRLARLIALGVDTFLIAFVVVADTLGRLYVRGDFHASELLFYGLVSVWLILLGYEGVSRLLRGGNGNGNGR